MFAFTSISAVLSLFFAVANAVTESATVTTTNGTVHGSNACGNPNTNAFLAIPYAKSPTGSLRFAAPQPYDNTYHLVASTPAPNCPQFGALFIESGPQSEDW